MKYIDTFLNSKTMYRLVLESLAILIGVSVIAGFAGLLPYSGLTLIGSFFVLAVSCYMSNYAFATLVRAPINVESASITAFILFCVIAPAHSLIGFLMIAVVGVIAMASKYVLVMHKKHVFNPVAIGVFILTLCGYSQAVWWVATPVLLPVITVIGFLFLRKTNRFEMFGYFVVTALLSITGFSIMTQTVGMDVTSLLGLYREIILSWPLVFFGVVMLTEPLTSPTTRNLRIVYAVIVGALFGAQFDVGPLYATPVFALVIGNVFTYITGSKVYARLTLVSQTALTPSVHEFVFSTPKPIMFRAGQYLEWTLPHKNPDIRGIRRYFTIASSPTENTLHLGVRIDPTHGSTFKKTLVALQSGGHISVTGLAGDFTLPKDTTKKMIFIAGGIGITPFRSHIQYMIDTGDKRDVVLLYSNKTIEDIAYREFLKHAESVLNLKVVYVINDTTIDISTLPGAIRSIDATTVTEQVPDYVERTSYISGPPGMVSVFEGLLRGMGVSRKNIKTDFFPGFM